MNIRPTICKFAFVVIGRYLSAIGLAITVLSSIEPLLKISRLASWILENWKKVITNFWEYIFPFLELNDLQVVMLTFSVFMTISIAITWLISHRETAALNAGTGIIGCGGFYLMIYIVNPDAFDLLSFLGDYSPFYGYDRELKILQEAGFFISMYYLMLSLIFIFLLFTGRNSYQLCISIIRIYSIAIFIVFLSFIEPIMLWLQTIYNAI